MFSASEVNTKCKECEKDFSNISNLRRHARRVHSEKIKDVAPLYYKNKDNFKFSCDICGRNFNMKKNFQNHLKTHTFRESEKVSKEQKKCPLCLFLASRNEDILKHFEKCHEIVVSWKNLEFVLFENFEQWLKEEEKKTVTKFVKKNINTSKIHITRVYNCHRSGRFVSSSKGLRNLKVKGSVKINGYCPASIKLIQDTDGICHVYYCETHVGHSSDGNLGYLYLTKEERQQLAYQINSKIPFEDILDNVKNSVSNTELERIYLLRRKDLHNIKSSNSLQHLNDSNIEVEVIVNNQLSNKKKIEHSIKEKKGADKKTFGSLFPFTFPSI